MSTLMNMDSRGGSHPHPIPSLSFSLSTPPDLSPDEEESFIPHGARPKNNSSPCDFIEEESTEEGRSPTQIDNGKGLIDSSQSPTSGGFSLGAPPGMGRRPSSQVLSDNEESLEMDLGSSISVFLESKADADNLVTVSESPPDSETRSLVDMTAKDRGMEDPELVNVANQLISEVISKAKEEANHKYDNGPNALLQIKGEVDPKLLELVCQFVSEVLEKAKTEAIKRISLKESTEKLQLGINITNNNVDFSKEKITLLPGGQRERRGPWYARAVRFLSGIFGKMCPCRTTGEP